MANISLTSLNTTYTQNFDSLTTAGALNLTGWLINEEGTSALNDEKFALGTGSDNAGNTYSFGASGSTDRALGTLLSGSLTPTIGVGFTNTTGQTITSLVIGYTGEEWRFGTTGRADRLDFQYSLNATSLTTGSWTDVDALDFSTPNTSVGVGALNGNSYSTGLSYTITGLNIAAGQSITLRWTDFNASGADDGLAIDNFTLTAKGTAPTPTVSIDNVSIAEGNAGTTVMTFTVTRSDTSTAFSVNYATANGTATAGSDYVATTGALTFTAGGPATQQVSITINGDTVIEASEAFTVALSNVVNTTGSTAIASGTGTGTIVNDDVTLTKISTIQGTGASSTMVGQTVTVEAIVVGDFQDGDGDNARNLKGFYIQEESKDSDGNVLTSEGIFVYLPSGTDVKIGDRVQVTGSITEYYGMTELAATSVAVVQAGAVADVHTMAAVIDLPSVGVTQSQDGDWQPDLEAYEGMLVTIPETMTITEQYNLDRFNEMKLVAGDRPATFTQENAPDAAAYTEYLKDVGASTITYDDGLFTENAPIGNVGGLDPNDNPSTAPGYSTDTAPRMGDTVTGLTGVLDYQWAGTSTSGATWRIRSVENDDNTFETVNDRPVDAPEVGGTLKVVSLNVLNYFKTLDIGSATTTIGQDPRGADSAEEFSRQTAKLVNALVELDADVLGLVELENDFKPGSTGNAIEYLVNALNAKLGSTVYAWVNPGQQYVGGDAIAVGFIYKLGTVEIAKGTQVAILNDADLPGLGLSGLLGDSSIGHLFDGTNTSRNAVAVTFTEKATGEEFTAIANHLKSKSGTGTGADADQGDGQGNWQNQRELAATALAAWAASDPTGSGDTDVVLLGDFNAYASEDAIKIIENGGFTNLQGKDASSYVFDGMTGTLDYIFANGSITDNITGVSHWAINADEADALDYNTDYGRDTAIFDPSSPARISDHDPLVIGLDLAHDEIRGTADADDLVGTDDHDVIRAYAGDDDLYGAAGDDQMFGGDGSDIYTWISGDGNDTIVEAAGAPGSDALVIADLGRAAVTFRAVGNDVQIVSKDNEVITLKDQLVGGGVETISLLGDATVLDRATIAAWAANHKPIAANDSGFIREGSNGSFDLVANDSDADHNALTILGVAVTSVDGIELTTTAAQAAFSLVDNKVRVDTSVFSALDEGDTATIKLAYAIDDGKGGVATASFTLQVDGATIYNVVYGDEPSEVLDGTAGADIIDAWYGNDVLDGKAGNDILIGGGDTDFLTGGAGADTFCFVGDDGSDTITDFTTTGSLHDIIEMSKDLFASFDALKAAMTDEGANAVLHYANDDDATLTFQNVHAADLTIDHFRFA